MNEVGEALLQGVKNETAEISFATVAEVSAGGITLILDGETESGGKAYKCNSAVAFRPGDRVKVHQDSGTLIVEFPIGEPGSRSPMPPGGTRGQALVKQSADDYDAAWGDFVGIPAGGTTGQCLAKNSNSNYDLKWVTMSGIPSGGSNGQVLTKTTAGASWSDPPTELPTGGAKGKALLKKSATNYDVEWGDIVSARLAYSSSVAVEIGSTGVIQSINTTQPSLGSSTYGKSFKDIYTSGGVLSFGASKLGFFGTTPIAKQSLSSSATLAQVITALKNYGLFT